MINKPSPRLQSWWLLWLATLITIAIVAASQLFTYRIGLLLEQQARELLAADILLESSATLPEEYRQKARELGLQTAETVETRTAVFVDDAPVLVELKAVSSEYPLRGQLETKPSLTAAAIKKAQGPEPGEIWLDNQLASELGKTLDIGYQKLSAKWLLHFEPDRGGSPFKLSPRVMMHLDDLPASGLLVAGSRAKYKLLLAGNSDALKAYETWAKPKLGKGEKIQTIESARPEMRNALERTRTFFAMSIVLTLVIAMVAIAITARFVTSREATKVAVMRSFGISSQRMLRHYLWQMSKVWLLALVPGLLAGMLAQYSLQWGLDLWFGSHLPSAPLTPYLLAAVAGYVSLLGFSLPALMSLTNTPPIQVLRGGGPENSHRRLWLQSSIGLASLFAVLLLIVPDVKLASWLLLAIILLGSFIPFLIKLLLLGLSRLRPGHFFPGNYLLSRLLNPQRNALFVMSGFTVTLLSVLLISQVKNQLLQEWEQQLPDKKPNYFMINIPTGDVEAVSAYLEKNHLPSSRPYALVRARLVEINGAPVENIEFESNRARRLVNHTFNISYSDLLPDENRIVAGQWLSESSEAEQFSVEEGMAKTLGLKPGDQLEFELAGTRFSGSVTSIRSVVWENFQPNFYVLGTQAQLAAQPQTWLLSSYISEDKKPLLKELVKISPSLTLLDLSELMVRIKDIINRASLALEIFFAFAALAAVIVLLSALKTSSQQRESEIALLQALGAGRKSLRMSQWAEFVLMGVFTGSLAAFFANLIGWLVADRFFSMSLGFSPSLWLYSIGISTALITGLGIAFIRRSFHTSPMRLLRTF